MYNELNEDLIIMSKENSFTKIKEVDYPNDVLKFFEKYSLGINDYIWFVSPFSNNFGVEVNEYREIYEELKDDFDNDIVPGFEPKENEGYPFDFYPKKNGLVPWAHCDNGTMLYFKYNDNSSEVVVYGDGYEFFKYPLSVTEFLYKLINKEIDCRLYLPSELFDGEIMCK